MTEIACYRMNMEIEIKLRSLRDFRKLSTRTAAELIGVSQSTYMDWERGRSFPSLRLLASIAQAFEVCPVNFTAYLFEHIHLVELIEISRNGPGITEAVSFYRKQQKGSSDDKIDSIRNDVQRLEVLLRQSLISFLPMSN